MMSELISAYHCRVHIVCLGQIEAVVDQLQSLLAR